MEEAKRVQRTLVSLILRSEAGILLLKRGQSYSEFLERDPDSQVGAGLWELFGGSLDFGETPRKAGVRETLEETGIAIGEGQLELRDCCGYTLKDSGYESHRIHIIYEAASTVSSEITLSEEHVAYQWMKDASALGSLSMIEEIRKSATACL